MFNNSSNTSFQNIDRSLVYVHVYFTLTFSFLGFVAIFVFYILTAKCICCKQCSCPQESLLEKCCGAASCAEKKEQQSPSCCSSSVIAQVLTVLQLCAKLLLVLANILYLVLLVTVGGGVPWSVYFWTVQFSKFLKF